VDKQLGVLAAFAGPDFKRDFHRVMLADQHAVVKTLNIASRALWLSFCTLPIMRGIRSSANRRLSLVRLQRLEALMEGEGAAGTRTPIVACAKFYPLN
jgi:hypothetical protein